MNKKKSIALITCHGWVGFSTSVINSARYWAQEGFEVDLYVSSITKNIPLPQFHEKNIRIIHSNKARHKFLFLDDLFFYLFYFKKKYDYVIGFDARGLIRAFIANLFHHARLIYHSLEFYENSRFDFFFNVTKKAEIFCSKYAFKIFSQDELRINYLMNHLSLSRDRFDIIYNSTIGNINKEKKHYFNDKFSINYNKKIILATGSLTREHCIEELIESVHQWDDNFVLVLHGFIPDKQFEAYILNKIIQLPQKIFLSTDLLNDSDKDIIFQSVDIGFVGFLPKNNNLKYAAGAAGKLFGFMQCGVPLIAYNTPGMYELVEKNNIGCVFDDWNGVLLLLNKIIINYNYLINNCYFLYKKYEFINQYKNINNKFL